MNIIRFLVYGNFLVSLSAGGLAYVSSQKIGSYHPFGIGLTVFFATLFIYNIQRIFRIQESRTYSSIRHVWLEKNQNTIKVLSSIGAVGALATYFIILGWSVDFWLLCFSTLIGILYAVKILPNFSSLRDIPYIKIYLIAFQWLFVSVLWPYFRIADEVQFPLLLSGTIFFFILAATIPFDIRDLLYDKSNKKTIPQMIGLKGAKVVGLLFLSISLLSYLYSFSKVSILLCSLCYIVLALLIMFSHPKRPELYFSGGIDGWIIVFALLIYFS